MKSDQLIGQSLEFLETVELASRASALDRPVLVLGERGTGKELIAERLHRLSPRWDAPLVVMNCAALPETLIEAELFGHEAGAFTGAARARTGRFEEADKGTLFLDELGTLSMAAQERLLRAVEYGEVARIGASRPRQVDVRIIAATNEDLPRAVEEGRFRADLLDRLSFEVICLPPLRARSGDVPLLADHFGRRMASEIGWSSWAGFHSNAMERLVAYPWPGNIRELRNVVERSVYRWEMPDRPVERIIFDPFASPWRAEAKPQTSPPRPGEGSPDPESAVSDLRVAVSAYEGAILSDTLARHRHNQRAAAAALNLSYDQLRHALRRHGLLGNRSGGVD